MPRFVRPSLLASCLFIFDASHHAAAQTTRYVRSDAPVGGIGQSWATAFRRVPDAVNVSQPGDSIWVAAGRYVTLSPGAPIELRPGVALYGGFAGDETSLDQRDWAARETIISGDTMGDDDIGGGTSDNTTPILSAQFSILASTIVDGFTICCSGVSGQGGGLRSLGSPTIRNCHFTRNIGQIGAAVYLTGSGGPVSPRLINCRFTRNGGVSSPSQNILVVEGPNVEARIINCSLIANSSSTGGILAVRSGSAIVAGCVVASNTMMGSEAAVIGGLNATTSFTLINTTIAGNRVLTSGPTAGLRVGSPAAVLIRNCILWGNTLPGAPVERAQFQTTSPLARFDYCRIQGWTGMTAGTGTSAADPLLADLDGPDDLFGTGDENVRLLSGSAAIDAGHNFYVWPDIADLDADGNTAEPTPFDAAGAPRYLDDAMTADTGVGDPPVVDIGAYEFAGRPTPCRADFNADSFVNSQDFFDFLAEFFQGCP